jgi:hypothetical protein
MHPKNPTLSFAPLFIVFLLFGANQVFCQTDFEYGILSGINSSILSGDETDNFVHRTGLRIGGFVAFESSSAFAIAPEIWYCHKGGKDEYRGNTTTIKLETIEINALGQAFVQAGGGTRIRFFAGPQLSLILSFRGSVLTYENTDAEFESGYSNVKSFLSGIVLGCGFDFIVFRDLRLKFDVRYEHGLSSVLSTHNVYDRTIAFSMGVGL